jgi:xylulose-5-phosphate/fructose-6-phosphate phosphoketolase
MRARLLDHREYIRSHGDDLPAIRNWTWGGSAGPGARRSSDTGGDNI